MKKTHTPALNITTARLIVWLDYLASFCFNKYLRHCKLLRKEWSHSTDPTANFIKKLFVTSCDNPGNQSYFCLSKEKEKKPQGKNSSYTDHLKNHLFHRIFPFLWCLTTWEWRERLSELFNARKKSLLWQLKSKLHILVQTMNPPWIQFI